jgi:hypothetical protein
MERELRPIPGFPNYLAGDDGSIWTLKRKGGNDRGAGRIGPPRQLKTHLNGSGYYTVNLDIGGKVYVRQVHRLILETFVGPAPEGYQACHYPDATRTNNRLENLRWDTRSENAKDKYRDRPFVTEKLCKRCGRTKKRTEFYADKRSSDGLKTECKRCHTKTSMATRDALKHRIANRHFMRQRRANNPQYGR